MAGKSFLPPGKPSILLPIQTLKINITVLRQTTLALALSFLKTLPLATSFIQVT